MSHITLKGNIPTLYRTVYMNSSCSLYLHVDNALPLQLDEASYEANSPCIPLYSFLILFCHMISSPM